MPSEEADYYEDEEVGSDDDDDDYEDEEEDQDDLSEKDEDDDDDRHDDGHNDRRSSNEEEEAYDGQRSDEHPERRSRSKLRGTGVGRASSATSSDEEGAREALEVLRRAPVQLDPIEHRLRVTAATSSDTVIPEEAHREEPRPPSSRQIKPQQQRSMAWANDLD